MNQQIQHPAKIPVSLPSKPALDQAVLEAIAYHNAGEIAEAETLYRTILASPDGHAVASYGFALLCTAEGRLREAIDAYRHAIALRPDFVEAYINLGAAVLTLGHREDAMTLFQRAVAIDPDNATALNNLGKVSQDLGQIDAAIAAYRAAIALQPDNAGFLTNLGAALLEQRAWRDSETVTRRAISLEPDNALAQANLGTALMHLGRREEAVAACRQAVALRPPNAGTLASLGGAMLELGEFPEAISLCRDAIALDPKIPSAHINLSHAFRALNELDDAAHAAHQAIALCPSSADFHFHLAHILLLQGNLAAGWAEYDWRWKLPDFGWLRGIHGEFSQPRWTGEDIGGKTLLIYTEQGLGDMILFARYLPLTVRKAGQVIVAAHSSICRLFQSVPGIVIVPVRDTPLPDFDVWYPLMSLPRAFATTLDSIPAAVPYLNAESIDRARWDRRIGGDGLRVGIVWAGNPATKRDHLRSPGLSNVASLFAVPGVTFVVLQVGAGRTDLDANPLPPHVIDLGEDIADLTDTAAIMSGLDLMISSCTAPLHLAGALGIPTWAMIPFAPYFPWLLKRTDTPWYPTMRLYRQEQPGRDWSGVMDRIALDLAALTRSKTDPVGTSPSELTNAASVDGASHETAPDRPLETETGPPNHQLRHQERIRMAETSLDRDITSSTYPASDPEDANKISILTSEENATESHHTGAEKDPRARTPSTADVLHVGCGAYNRAKLPPVFDVGWHEIRLDIDPDVHPDFVANITDMRAIADGAADAVYSSHNIEHLYPHEVSLALREMRRVLKPNGFVLIKLPDLQEVARHVAEGGLEQPLYESPMGPIAPLDILFGHRPSLESGNAFMAHRTGFTSETLGSALIKAGFAAAVVQRDAPSFCLTAIAFRSMPDETRINWAQARMLPDAGLPAVLYTQTG